MGPLLLLCEGLVHHAGTQRICQGATACTANGRQAGYERGAYQQADVLAPPASLCADIPALCQLHDALEVDMQLDEGEPVICLHQVLVLCMQRVC